MSNQRRIVVGVDFSELDPAAIETALLEAVATPTEIHAVYVYLPVTTGPVTADLLPSYRARLIGHVRETIATILGGADAPAGLRVSAHVIYGSPAREIVHLAASLDADLVVVGTHGRRGLRRLVVGSTAEHVVRYAGCPVLVARHKDHDMEGVVPEIEPLCPDCAAQRAATGGEELWCARHSEHHPRAHTYHYEPPSNAPARPWGFGNRQVFRR